MSQKQPYKGKGPQWTKNKRSLYHGKELICSNVSEEDNLQKAMC